MTRPDAADGNTVVKGGTVFYETKVKVREVSAVYTMERKNDLYIFAGVDAQDKNRIPITLPTISLKKLELNGYKVGSKYYERTYWEFEEGLFQNANADYEKALKDYEEALKKYEKELEQYRLEEPANTAEWNAYRAAKLAEDQKIQAWRDQWQEEREIDELDYNRPIYETIYVNGESQRVITGYRKKTKVFTKDGAPPEPPRDPTLVPPPELKEPLPPTKPLPPVKSPTPSAGAPGWIRKARRIRVEDVLDPVDRAIAYVSKYRSILGAQQNRLEHAYRNNLNTSENTSASESAIRDTDMAEEMVAYSRSSILEQSIESMLAQANQSNQGVLNLLG